MALERKKQEENNSFMLVHRFIYTFTFIYTFKRSISAKALAKAKAKAEAKAKVEQKLFEFIKKNKSNFLKILFSSNLIVGFLVSFKEYVDVYIKHREHLLISSIENLDIKIFNFNCINQIGSNEALLQINKLIFIVSECYKKSINLSVYRGNFFNYCVEELSLSNERLFVIKKGTFFTRVSMQLFICFFRYVEHIRLAKYNEYIISHPALMWDYQFRRLYISLHIYGPSFFDTVDSGFTANFRKALLKRVLLIFNESRLTEFQLPHFVNELELATICLDKSFVGLHFLNRFSFVQNVIFIIDRKNFRNNVYFLAGTQIMKKDRNWVDFHRLDFDNFRDLMNTVFSSLYIVTVFTGMVRQMEKNIFTWKYLQAAAGNKYLIGDLEIFKKKGKGKKIKLNTYRTTIGERRFWSEAYFYYLVYRSLIIAFFSTSFIRLIGQVDYEFVMSLMPVNALEIGKFYTKSSYDLEDRTVFYLFPVIWSEGQGLFFLDYYIWRVGHCFQWETDLESTGITASYDRILLSRVGSIFNIFQYVWECKPSVQSFDIHFSVYNAYLILRDLFYKNVYQNFDIHLLIFFLDETLNHGYKNSCFLSGSLSLLQELKSLSSEDFFCSIAPVQLRQIDLIYVTDPILVRFCEGLEYEKTMLNFAREFIMKITKRDFQGIVKSEMIKQARFIKNEGAREEHQDNLLRSRKERRAKARKEKELLEEQSMIELAKPFFQEMVKKEMMKFAKIEFSNVVKRIRGVKIKLAKISRMTKVEKYQHNLITEEERKFSEYIDNMTKRQRMVFDKQNRLYQKKLEEERQLRLRAEKLDEKKVKLAMKQQERIEQQERMKMTKLAKAYRIGMLKSAKSEKLLLVNRYDNATSPEEKNKILRMIANVNEKIKEFSFVSKRKESDVNTEK